jgi:peroxiredoxin
MSHGFEIDWSTLPQPLDDGAAAHLPGLKLPAIPLQATDGRAVTLAALPRVTIVYAYPMTGRPDRALPEGWDMIPGARGCTPQSCAFRDRFAELQAAGADAVFGLSTQDTAYQSEAADRLHLPFPLLSDNELTFATALKLPTFEVEGATLLRRLTLILRDGAIAHVQYPVFPPDSDAPRVLDWLHANARNAPSP